MRSKASRHARGYGKAWDRLRRQALQRDKGLCLHCKTEGRFIPATDVDHIVRKADGGTDALGNLQSLCRAHHQAKTRGENSGREVLASGCDHTGVPLDPRHHWRG